MKKTRRFLAVILSAIMAVTMGTSSVSAERSWQIVDTDKIVFSYRIEPSYTGPDAYYEYHEFLIDENYNMCGLDVCTPKALVVRMINGAEPELPEGIEASKLSKYQLRTAITDGCWTNSERLDTPIEVTDDVYRIHGFKTSEETYEYQQNILESGKADYAEPVYYQSYGVAVPDDMQLYFEKNGIENTNFDNNLFTVRLEFDSTEQAENFDVTTIDGVEENLYAKLVHENDVYFQLVKEAEGEILTDVLIDLQESEETNNMKVNLLYLCLESPEGGSDNIVIPNDYAVGDVDCNSDINLYDIVEIAKNIMGMRKLSESELILADYDDNGEVNLYDAIGIAKSIM